jgi:hypothetical protein
MRGSVCVITVIRGVVQIAGHIDAVNDDHETDAKPMLLPIWNLLAFHAEWIALLWRRVAVMCHLPLEVSELATGKLDVPSADGGIGALSEAQVPICNGTVLESHDDAQAKAFHATVFPSASALLQPDLI